MKKADMIGRVLFWLGMLTDIGGMAVLAYFSFGRAVVPVKELNRVTAVTVIGIVMMAASIAISMILIFKRSPAMQGKWSIVSQIVGDEEIFRVCRIRDIRMPGVLGNREFRSELFSDEMTAREYADKLNREE